ncbi:hypothetical protein CLV28_2105 [Sediminihabitans luteus]|uniref:ABC transporter family protein n=1 Tax=Sediminihabitans luteus TaxID=1138585 RepID=A0A2M9CEC4_9CELL|nr:hypothetical protein [Sediminihabitans luteus]PJJ70274.1 hypothetical protein CLV28_2105 [Sediminihabitans luteus]GII97745.1 ABC transporter ATP-binding protein [Sediminihabitans luteus]
MQITLDQVRVDGRRDPLLAPFSGTLATRERVLVAAEPGHGHTALALVATGRMRPAGGSVVLDAGDRAVVGARTLRDVSAVVDVPGITEPDDALTVADVVAEGLTFAGLRAWPGDVARWIAAYACGSALDRRARVDQLAGPDRTALLTALAAARPDVRFLVLVLPDRHGGDPHATWELARHYAEQGYGVLVGATRATARLLGAELLGARSADPLHSPPEIALAERFPEPEPEPEPAPEPGPAASDTAPDHDTRDTRDIHDTHDTHDTEPEDPR